MTKIFMILGIVVFFMASLFFLGFAQEEITITTYYPSPFGSYRDLEAQRLAVGTYPVGTAATYWPDFATVRTGYADTIAIGGDGANNDSEIRINAPLARNMVTFWNLSLNGGLGGLANINAANLARCVNMTFGPDTLNQECPVDTRITIAPLRPEDLNGNSSTVAATSGTFLCCTFQ